MENKERRCRMPTLGRALRILRRWHGLTMKDVAVQVECCITSISDYETGRTAPNQRVLNAYAALTRAR